MHGVYPTPLYAHTQIIGQRFINHNINYKCVRNVYAFFLHTPFAVDQINELNETCELTSLTMRVPVRDGTLASYDSVRKVIFGNFLKSLRRLDDT